MKDSSTPIYAFTNASLISTTTGALRGTSTLGQMAAAFIQTGQLSGRAAGTILGGLVGHLVPVVGPVIGANVSGLVGRTVGDLHNRAVLLVGQGLVEGTRHLLS
jgi:hypothetical protein